MKEVTRHIPKETVRDLWIKAGARCQFRGHNELLYKSPVTQEASNQAEKAHIYSFSEKGPRGRGPFAESPEALNDISNLMLICHGCHTVIDRDKLGEKYSADLLQSWKMEHENRIELVTGINPHNKSHIVLYSASIGAESSPLEFNQCAWAMFPCRYPAEHRPIELSMSSALRDHSPAYWQAEEENLRQYFDRLVLTRIQKDDCKHFSIFALAPQPLLVLLGALFTDKVQVDVYQLKREPEPSWQWQDPSAADTEFIVTAPDSFEGAPVLVLALSAHIAKERITSVVNGDVSIWEITIPSPHNDFLKSKLQLSAFRETIRKLMVEIQKQHGRTTPLRVFSVMPVSCCIELGRSRMPQGDMPWILYNQSNVENCFFETITLEGNEHAV